MGGITEAEDQVAIRMGLGGAAVTVLHLQVLCGQVQESVRFGRRAKY